MPRLRSDKNISSQPLEDLNLNIHDTKEARNPKSLLKSSHRVKSIRTVGSVYKELSGKAFTSNLQNFHPTGGLHQKEILCNRDHVSIRFSSPLHNISDPWYIKNWKCEEMLPNVSNTAYLDPAIVSVIAVKLNWKKGVKVEQNNQYSRRTRVIEPEMNNIEFDFESKIKFQKQLKSTVDELFPDGNLMVMDGNDCHGLSTIKSKDVKNDLDLDDTAPTGRNLSTFSDAEEHQILLVPFNSKSGFDSDVSKRYQFPYHAKFSIGQKTYEHKFDLSLALSSSPQHFGLVFSFPDSDGQNTLKIKSLLTVYSVYPTSTKFAKLPVYKSNCVDNNGESSNSGSGKSKKSVKNLTGTVSSKLTDDNLTMGGFGSFDIHCDIANSTARRSDLNILSYDQAKEKHKSKQRVLQNMVADARESHVRKRNC